MQVRLRLICWTFAMASLAMMIGVRAVHSPLAHQLGTCGTKQCSSTQHCSSGSCSTESEPPVATKSSCSHVHHSHTQSTTHRHEGCSDQPSPSDPIEQGHHHHSDECQLCQFLVQVASPIACPISLVGEDLVTRQPISEVVEGITFSLPGPYVRGPPSRG